MKTFNLLGHKIEIDSNLEKYSNIKNCYCEIASGMCAAFDEFWDEYCNNIHDVMELCPKFFEQVITFLVEDANARLVAQDIYDVDGESFYEKYKDDYLNSSFFDEIAWEYERLMRTQYQSYALAEREYEYNSTASQRWSASGFGISGAIAGAIRAGAMNFVGDVVAGFKAVRNYEKLVGRLDSFYSEKFEQLYTEQLYAEIEEGIWELCISGMCAYIDELEEQGVFEYPDIDREKADIIYNNTMRFGQDDIIVKNMIDCIRMYPYGKEYYTALYKMPSLEEDDISTIEEMVEFFYISDGFLDDTEEIRNERKETKCIKNIEDSADATIIEKAATVKRFLADAEYGCESYKTEVQDMVIRFVNDAVKEIAEEVLKSCECSDLAECLDEYCKKNKITKNNKQNLLIVIKCFEIMQKYPFFATLCKEDCNLSLTDNYLDFLGCIAELYSLMEKDVYITAPDEIRNILQEDIFKQWIFAVDTLEKVECFEKISLQLEEMFLITSINENEIDERKKNIVDGEQKLDRIISKYQDKIEDNNLIDLELLDDLMNDISMNGLDECPLQVVTEYKQRIVDVLTKDYELKSAAELFRLYEAFMSYKDIFLIEKGKWLNNIFLEKITSNATMIKQMNNDGDCVLRINIDLSERKIAHKNAKIRQKVETFYQNIKEWKKYITCTSSYAKFNELAERCIIACKQINVPMKYNEIYAVCWGGAILFYITREGIVFSNDQSSTFLYIKYDEIDCFTAIGNQIIINKKDTSEYLGFLDARNKVQDIMDFMCQFLIYLYELPNIVFDKKVFAKQINEVEKMTKDIASKNIEELNSLKKKLMKYPIYIREPELEKIQVCYEEKVADLRRDFDDLIKDYPEKTEKQLEDILLEIEKFPEGLTEEVVPQIKKVYEEKVNNRLTEEINTLTENYQDKDVEALKAISKKLKKYPKELTEEIQTQIDETCEVKAYNRLREEFEELIKNYPEKTEEELEDILSKVEKFPKEFTKDIVPQIRKEYEEKYNSRLNGEVKELVKNYLELDIKELSGILDKLKKGYRDVALGNEYISTVSDRIQELINEAIMSLGGEVKNLSYLELIEKHYSIVEDKKLEETIRAKCLEEISKESVKKGNELVRIIQSRIKQDYRTQNGIMKKVEFLSEESFSTKDTSTPYIFEKLYKEGKLQWFERPIIRVRDAVSQAMHEKTGHDSLEGLIITSHQIVIKPEYSFDWQNIPIRHDTKFFIKKKWLGNELRVDNVKADFAFENEYEENSIVNFLNDILDRIRQSDLLQISVKSSVTQPAYTQQNANVQVPETLVQPQMQAPPQLQPQPLPAMPTANQFSLMNMNVQRSFTDVAGFVNRFPSTVTKCLIGNLNPKFSKKVKNAVKAYAFSVREEEIFALFDDTFLGSGKEGFVMTMQGMIIKTSYRDTFNCAYSDIKGIKIIYDESTKLTKIFVDTQYGLGYISGSTVEAENLANRINEIVKYLYGLEVAPYIVEKSSQATVN